MSFILVSLLYSCFLQFVFYDEIVHIISVLVPVVCEIGFVVVVRVRFKNVFLVF